MESIRSQKALLSPGPGIISFECSSSFKFKLPSHGREIGYKLTISNSQLCLAATDQPAVSPEHARNCQTSPLGIASLSTDQPTSLAPEGGSPSTSFHIRLRTHLSVYTSSVPCSLRAAMGLIYYKCLLSKLLMITLQTRLVIDSN